MLGAMLLSRHGLSVSPAGRDVVAKGPSFAACLHGRCCESREHAGRRAFTLSRRLDRRLRPLVTSASTGRGENEEVHRAASVWVPLKPLASRLNQNADLASHRRWNVLAIVDALADLQRELPLQAPVDLMIDLADITARPLDDANLFLLRETLDSRVDTCSACTGSGYVRASW